jgi:hypothetical protein
MSKQFRPWTIDEPMFLPAKVQDFVGAGHLARFVLNLVTESIDLTKITGTYGSERGQPPFNPVMMTVLLIYAYCCGVHSSRRRAWNGSISSALWVSTGPISAPSPSSASDI